MNRRQFLALAATPLAAQDSPEYRPVLQAGVYVWTQFYARSGGRAPATERLEAR